MNNINKMHEIIGKQYMELREANEARDFWFNAYTDVQGKVKEAETENVKLKAELDQLKAEHEALLDSMLELKPEQTVVHTKDLDFGKVEEA